MGKITQRGESSTELKLSNAQVPDTVLRPGPTGLEALSRYERAGGDMGAARDALAMKARQTLVSPDGSLNTSKLAAFRTAYNRVLSHPSMAPLNTALKNGEDAQAAVAQAAANAKQANERFEASAAARLTGAAGPEDVQRTVGSMFGTRNSNATFQSLAESTKGNQPAIDGVRRAIVGHIESKFIGNAEVGASDQPGMKADQFQTFMKNNHDSLRQFFTDNEVRTMGLLGLDMRRSARSMYAIKNPGGSDTAQNQEAVKKLGSVIHNAYSVVTQLLEPAGGAGMGLALGGDTGAGIGVVAAVGARLTREFLNTMRNAGLSKVDDLVTEGMLHPEIGRILMAKVTPETAPRIVRALQHAVTRAAAVDLGQQAQQ